MEWRWGVRVILLLNDVQVTGNYKEKRLKGIHICCHLKGGILRISREIVSNIFEACISFPPHYTSAFLGVTSFYDFKTVSPLDFT